MKIALAVLLGVIVLGLGLAMVPWAALSDAIGNIDLSPMLSMFCFLIPFALLGVIWHIVSTIWRRYD